VEAVEAAKSQVHVYSTEHVFNLWYPLHKIYCPTWDLSLHW